MGMENLTVLFQYLPFIIAAYLSGSVLYAKIFGRIFANKDITQNTKDGNPGVANAFERGGFWCGVFTLVFELAKGLIPVLCCLKMQYEVNPSEIGLALVIIAPVAGHIFSLFYGFKGGKGIAVTFGVLLGCYPYITAVVILAFFFIFFSLVVRITPHLHRTIGAYAMTAFALIFVRGQLAIKIGFDVIALLVGKRLFDSKEEKENCKVELLWMR